MTRRGARTCPGPASSSCLDVTKWVILGKSRTPVPLPSKRLTKHVVTVTVGYWSDGWRVLTDEPQSRQPC